MKSKTDTYFLDLHHRRVAGEILSGDEREELESFLAQRDAEEMKRLAPQIAKMNEETAIYLARNVRLSELVERQERLAARLWQVAEETRHEGEAIRQELSQLMGSSAS